jgi:RNA polymerase sigma factor (sigma-70 family)
MDLAGDVRSEAGSPGTADGLEQELSAGRDIVLGTLRKYFSRLPREEAEDIAQELCVAYWRQRDRIRVYQAWFYTAARSRAVSALRRHQPVGEVEDHHLPPQEPPDARHETVRQLFFTLRDHSRQLLGCLLIAGWTPQELAAAAGRNVRALNEQRARCLKTLRQRWMEAHAGSAEGLPVLLPDLPPPGPAETPPHD